MYPKDYNKVCLYSEKKYQHVFNESIGRIGAGKQFILKDLAPTNMKFIGINRKESIGKEYIHDNFPDVWKESKMREMEVVDATCPLVT